MVAKNDRDERIAGGTRGEPGRSLSVLVGDGVEDSALEGQARAERGSHFKLKMEAPSMKFSEVAIVIPTFRRTEILIQCLRQLPCSEQDLDVIVTDDGDAELTRQALHQEFPRVTVVQGPQKGPAANRNCGAKATTAPLLIFLDDDCIPSPDLVERYSRFADENPGIDVFEGRITAIGKRKGFADYCPDNETGGHLWSCNFAIRHALFDKIGGFDEHFPFAANEDMALYLRAKSESLVKFLPDAQVRHAWQRRSGAKPLRHAGLSTLLFIQLYYPDHIQARVRSHLHAAARTAIITLSAHIREHAFADPLHYFRRIAYDLKIAIVAAGWSHRAGLSRFLFPPCCNGCNQILTQLASPRDHPVIYPDQG